MIDKKDFWTTLFFVGLMGLAIGFLVAVFLNIQLDDRNFIDFNSAMELDTELNNYCNSHYGNMFGVNRWYYDAYGKFSAFQCKSNSPIEPVTKLLSKRKNNGGLRSNESKKGLCCF